VPRLGRPDWWALWYRALGLQDRMSPESFGTHLSAEYLDVAAAVAGHGIAIGSPILFRSELASGRLILAHDLSPATADPSGSPIRWPGKTAGRSRDSVIGYAMRPRAIAATRVRSSAAQ
jgi:DNA-binding transcriptional LysR family regulator